MLTLQFRLLIFKGKREGEIMLMLKMSTFKGESKDQVTFYHFAAARYERPRVIEAEMLLFMLLIRKFNA